MNFGEDVREKELQETNDRLRLLMAQSKQKEQEMQLLQERNQLITPHAGTNQLGTLYTQTQVNRYGDETETVPELNSILGPLKVSTKTPTVVSTLTDSTCTKEEMKSLQELSLGGGNLDEVFCEATATMVKKCTKDILWQHNKFLTDDSMQRVDVMKCDELDGSMVSQLLRYTKFNTMNKVGKLKFWRVYGPVVQKELNEMKSNRARMVKDILLRGM